MITPSLPEFIRLASKYNLIAVREEIVVDQVTPVSVYETLHRKQNHSFLLESVEGGEQFGRFSFVGQNPHAVFTSKNNRVTYREKRRERTWDSLNPLQDLKKIFDAFRPAPVSGLPRFWGGAVGFLDYDTVRSFERLPNTKPDQLKFPSISFQLTGEVVVFDRFSQTAQVISSVHVPSGGTSRAALSKLYKEAVRSIQRQIRDIRQARSFTPANGTPLTKGPRPLVPKKQYIDAVERAKEYIRAGDIIQVVLSQRWALNPAPQPFQVYRALRMVNPSPYMYCLHFPELDIVGSSPELLVRKENESAETRPIAGTRRRGATKADDARLAEELKNDPKERAEHLMLVDLGRNDLGRVCEPGSVRVPDLMTIENYSHVMHLVSSVVGRVKPDANAFDLFQACFPAGTVSGAPKIRAMQIIDELEPFQRGPYAGAVGYFSYTGNMDMAITIRTLLFHRGTAYMQAGAGIVADSVPEHEFQECLHKAAALFAAVKKVKDLA